MSQNVQTEQEPRAEVEASALDAIVVPEASYDQEEVKKAFDTIKAAMIADEPEQPGSYAHSWHCNLAMCFYDELMQHEGHDGAEMCNAAASRFMKMCFGVDTKA